MQGTDPARRRLVHQMIPVSVARDQHKALVERGRVRRVQHRAGDKGKMGADCRLRYFLETRDERTGHENDDRGFD